MTDAYFVATGPGRFVPTAHVVGPWSGEHMHGGPPSALVAHEMAAVATGQVPTNALISRFTIEFLRPVPVADLEVAVKVVRPGRRVALVDAAVTCRGEPVLLARAWLSRRDRVQVPTADMAPPPRVVPLAIMDRPGWGGGYLQSIEWGWAEGAFEQPGPAAAWTRARYPLVAGRTLAPVERVLLVADSGSGLSALADPRDLIFVNTDLTVHLIRPPRGELVWMRSQSLLDPEGVGLATTALGDGDGQVGVAAQSLFVAQPH